MKRPSGSVFPKNVRPTSDEPKEPSTGGDKPSVPAATALSRRQRILAALLLWSKRIGIVALGLALVAAITLVILVRHYEADLPSVADVRGNYHPPQVTRVLARDGTTLAELFTERRTVIPIAQV